MKAWKVLHCPTTVGGNPQALSRVLNELGVDSSSLAFEQNTYNYKVDQVLWDKGESRVIKECKRVAAIVRTLLKYDVVHYNFGMTLADPLYPGRPRLGVLRRIFRMAYSLYMQGLQFIELEMLRFLKKPVFVHYQGDDARQGDYSLRHFEYSIATQVDELYYNQSSDEFKRKSIKRLAGYCERIYALNPDLLHVLPVGSKFTPYCHVDLSEWQPVYTQVRTDRPLRIGHAPSHRKVKGTDLVLQALDALKREGYSFELELVEGVSHQEARQRYETIDVLVDQLFAGWYGGLAVEVMALGKPVLVYLREDDLRFIPVGMRRDLPFVEVTPDSIEGGLRQVLDMTREELFALAKRSRAYVEKWHDPFSISREIKADYESALRKHSKL